jgi:hypothetical protein
MGDGDQSHALALMDKKVSAALKRADWPGVEACLDELRLAVLGSAPSRSDGNWNAPAAPLSLAATEPEKRLAWAVAEGLGQDRHLAQVPTATGLLGERQARSLDLAGLEPGGPAFYAFKVHSGGEDIIKGLRDLLVSTALYRAFLESPRLFGYSTERSPLLLEAPVVRWELVAPKDLLNPRKSEMRWGERDVQGMQAVLKKLGVASFELARLQAEGEALRAGIAKESFSAPRARQWFEQRVRVAVA